MNYRETQHGGEFLEADEVREAFGMYQGAAAKTAIYPEHLKVLYPTLGLAGESGEVANKVKKIYRDCGGEITQQKREELVGELGDVLWYVAAIATDLGVSLGDIAMANLITLYSRMARGKLSGDGDKR